MATKPKLKKKAVPLDVLMESIGDCLTPEAARKVLKLKADRKLQARLDELSVKCGAGELSREEREEYTRYVSLGTLVAFLKSRSRLLLAKESANA